ncbi:P-loop containing nucleoside triphosphate hydrolase protein [Phascolomyces articulosus]|uniref:ATP-dependent RNA helicase DED1 n=1 Tax=Phascolomyces articulosus TaxID=60185 RepID=A0AAD5PFN8_9FUNG|nr:P-loop containing nucleoside triphosphate hydrolase protein [Phascolomyces articulosus]
MGLPPQSDRPDRSYNWASNRVRYEYNENAVGEDGMAPRDEALEGELFGVDPTEQHTPLDFSKYANIPVTVERGDAPTPVKTFDQADLHPVMKENIRLAGYAQPTPVQTLSIPIVTGGKDLMACAQTGSGKTAAFLLPSLSGLFGRAKELAQPRPAPFEMRSFKAEPLILIIAPTRELCSQIFDECRKFTYRSSLRPCAVYGGADTLSQIRQLERGCDVLAASPGRLMDFVERGKVGLNRVKYLVLDEADRMLDMGFEPIIRALVLKRGLNPERQTLMYSATFPRAIRKLARDFLRPDYLFLKVGRVGGTTSSITQKVMYVEEENKREELRTLLNSQPPSRTLIFVETKRSADSLDQYLYERSFPSTSIHGDRTQMEREDALIAFKTGKCPILVATAVAARGIDIRNVMHVINYDMPEGMDEYIHRIGRTARVGRSGLATSFYNERSEGLAYELTKLLKECKQEIPDFLQSFITEDQTWDEDLPEEDVPAPEYAGQEYVPQERTAPGAPPAEGGDAWGGDSGGGSGGGYGGKPGDWSCPSCSFSNFASRNECKQCQTANPNPSSGGGRERRDGDWDCSCGAVNFSRRTDCYKCHAAREGGGDNTGGYGDYGNTDYGATSTATDTGAGWDASAASVGWGGDNNAAPATTSSGGDAGWGGASAAAPAAASSGGGWGSSEPTAAPAPASGGWGATSSEPAAPAASSGGGWGSSEPATSAGGGGWGAPQQQQPAPAPAPASNGWGSSEPAKPAEPASNGWGSSEPAKPAAPAAGGWGAPPSEPAKAPAPSPPVQQLTPPPSQPTQPPAPAPAPSSGGDGWGAPPAQASGDGWGAPPAQASGDGWGAPPSNASGAGWN